MLLYIEQRAHEILLWRPITFLSYHKTVLLELGPFSPSFQYDMTWHTFVNKAKRTEKPGFQSYQSSAAGLIQGYSSLEHKSYRANRSPTPEEEEELQLSLSNWLLLPKDSYIARPV